MIRAEDLCTCRLYLLYQLTHIHFISKRLQDVVYVLLYTFACITHEKKNGIKSRFLKVNQSSK